MHICSNTRLRHLDYYLITSCFVYAVNSCDIQNDRYLNYRHYNAKLTGIEVPLNALSYFAIISLRLASKIAVSSQLYKPQRSHNIRHIAFISNISISYSPRSRSHFWKEHLWTVRVNCQVQAGYKYIRYPLLEYLSK